MKNLTIIVASLNDQLIETFLNNMDKNFFEKLVFVVPKSYSSKINYVKIINQDGFGIYNALNSGIKFIKTEYYLILGTDDKVDNFLLDKLDLSNSQVELLTFNVDIGGKVHAPMGNYLIHAHKSFISEHSVGTIIKKNLHFKFGFYNETYQIASDAEFLIICYLAGIKINYSNKILGTYSLDGLSSKKYLKGQIELLKIFYKLNNIIYFIIYFIIWTIRVLKNYQKWI